MKNKVIYYTLGIFFLVMSCSFKTETKAIEPKEDVKIEVPRFNADSAYRYTEQQVAFGPRVPNTQAHINCGHFLANELRRHGAQVVEQDVVLYNYANTALNAKNIIGSFAPEKKTRLLLCAHWDSRPYADHDPDPANHHTPIDGANDGAGACGVLLELARHFKKEPPAVGVDIVFFDAEDWGTPSFERGSEGWCLGSEYWAQNPHVANYRAKYGILLDMVSAPGARFYKEEISMYYAGNLVEKVWDTAQNLGFGSYFIDQRGGMVEDDHVKVNQLAKIPCIDIIHHDENASNGFGHYWHTLEDNMNHVDTRTMNAVGTTVMQVIYNER